jgi:hypothetical protein
MIRRGALFCVLFLAAAAASAQTRSPAPRSAGSPPARKSAAPALTQAAPDVVCPAPLGVGVRTNLSFCDVMTGRDPSAGILVSLPPHRGPVILTFDLHNRQTYSEEQVKANRAYTRYTATIGVLAMDNTLISRAVVQSEFRNEGDLLDRIGGGAGPGGVKAVAPTGTEPITITIPEREKEVSILGEKLTVERIDGTATYSSPGRPIAIISNLQLRYRPAPAPKPKAPAPKTTKKPA